MLKRFVSTSVLVVLVFAVASGADAFTSDKRTYFTFSQPVALPGVTLPAGTYMFRLVNETTSRNVIQVANRKGNESYAMIVSMPAYRGVTEKEPTIQFMETATGVPVAVRAWWSAGDSTGYELIYSEEQRDALNRIALAQPPPAAAGEEAAGKIAEGEPTPLAVPRLGDPEAHDVIEGASLPPEAESQAQAGGAQSPAGQPPAEEPQETAAQTREELPGTASPIPLLLLMGVGSVFIGLRMLRRP